MSKPRNWMPLSQSAFASRTWGMSIEEIGAFCLIWSFLAQQNGTYRLNEKSLATLTRLSVHRWRKIAPRVLTLFVIDGDTVSLPRKPTRRKSLSIAVKKFVFGRDGNKCRYCGATEGELHIDHIVPLARGGSDEPENLCVACKPCNSSKNASMLDEWMQ